RQDPLLAVHEEDLEDVRNGYLGCVAGEGHLTPSRGHAPPHPAARSKGLELRPSRDRRQGVRVEASETSQRFTRTAVMSSSCERFPAKISMGRITFSRIDDADPEVSTRPTSKRRRSREYVASFSFRHSASPSVTKSTQSPSPRTIRSSRIC